MVHKHTPETIEKLRERNKMSRSESLSGGRNNKVDLINMDNNETTSVDTQTDAAAFLGLHPKSLSKTKIRALAAGIPFVVKAKAEGIKAT